MSKERPCSWCSPVPTAMRSGGGWVAYEGGLLWICRDCIATEEFKPWEDLASVSPHCAQGAHLTAKNDEQHPSLDERLKGTKAA